jgi:ribonuclease J
VRGLTANIASAAERTWAIDSVVTVGAATRKLPIVARLGCRICSISHSIPESAGLLIDSPDGRVLHSGDFKIDERLLLVIRGTALWKKYPKTV